VKIDLRSYTRRQLEEWVTGMGEPAFRGRQLFRWLWNPGFSDINQATDLSRKFRELVGKTGEFYLPETECVKKSVDGTVKWAFRLRDGRIIETVLIPEKAHTTICVSSQVGCAMGCSFCHTASMGFVRQLVPSEIAGQVLAASAMVKPESRPRNIVFMGMGEPFANYENVMAGIEILTDDLGLNFSCRRITISTCGLVDGIKRMEKDGVDAGLAISLHAPDDSLRSAIMPVNRLHPLEQLLDACRNFRMKARRRITFEYLLLAGINDSPEHAERVALQLRGIRSKINLIPFNESKGLPYGKPGPRSVERFRALLMKKGYTVIVRKSKGRDISAACGQLYAEIKG
jgi:23S rRNA (adenine2503-C2)-methyltransferase